MNTQHPDPEQFVTEARLLTEEAHDSGLYCAEAVVTALAMAQGIESGLVPKRDSATAIVRSCRDAI